MFIKFEKRNAVFRVEPPDSADTYALQPKALSMVTIIIKINVDQENQPDNSGFF